MLKVASTIYFDNSSLVSFGNIFGNIFAKLYFSTNDNAMLNCMWLTKDLLAFYLELNNNNNQIILFARIQVNTTAQLKNMNMTYQANSTYSK